MHGRFGGNLQRRCVRFVPGSFNLTLERDLKCAHNQLGAVMWGECCTAYKADPTISWGSHLPTGAFPEMHVSRLESASAGLRAGGDPEKSCRRPILTTSSAGSLASMFTRGGAMDRDTEQVREPASKKHLQLVLMRRSVAPRMVPMVSLCVF